MAGLKSQRRLAAEILKIGQNRIWIDPSRTDDAEVAITRDDIRRLIHEGVIKSLPKKGVSRARARILNSKKKEGRRHGPGSRSGKLHAKITKKEEWMSKVRALRKRLRELKGERIITENTYRKTYLMASSGRFGSIADMERHLKTQELWRKH